MPRIIFKRNPPEDDWNELFADPKRLRRSMPRLFEAEHGKRFAIFQVPSRLGVKMGVALLGGSDF